MIEELHHIGIAVRSLDESLPRYVDELGMVLDGREHVASEEIDVAVVLAGKTRIELMEPTAETSPVAKFIEKRGPGIHHLAFKVGDCDQVVKVLTEGGADMIDKVGRPGAHGTKVGFMHPRHLGGVLAEFVEDPQ
ncbi:MAG: methylmalonyl-CoA epimerase [Planctomycetota bacterium]|jgi:methylmalonyl-CoA/ethylmalonyl-CoA epimerase